jgi:hypothetical protein
LHVLAETEAFEELPGEGEPPTAAAHFATFVGGLVREFGLALGADAEAACAVAIGTDCGHAETFTAGAFGHAALLGQGVILQAVGDGVEAVATRWLAPGRASSGGGRVDNG